MKGSGWVGAPEVPRSLQSTAGSAWGAGGNPSVSGAHLVHSSTAKAFLQDTFQHSVAELGAQGTGSTGRTGGADLTPSPGPSSVPRSSSASWITTSVKNLKPSSSSQLGVALPGVAVPKGMAAGGSGKLEGLDAQSSASTSALLLLPSGLTSSSLPVPHGSALPWVQPLPGPGCPGGCARSCQPP